MSEIHELRREVAELKQLVLECTELLIIVTSQHSQRYNWAEAKRYAKRVISEHVIR